MLNREKFWSPAYKDVYRRRAERPEYIAGTRIPFTYTCEKACGNIERDTSGTIGPYSIPCRKIFEGMGMDYDAHDGQYVDREGNLVAITYGYDQILVKKEPFLRFLEQNDLAILWIVRGEKRVYLSGGTGCLSEHDPCGIYYLDSDKNPEGVLRMYKRV